MDYGAAVIGYYPYRCRECKLRFHRFRNDSSQPAATRRPSVEREIKATRSAMRAQLKRQELLIYAAAVMLFLVFLYYITRDRGGLTGALSPVTNNVVATIVV